MRVDFLENYLRSLTKAEYKAGSSSFKRFRYCSSSSCVATGSSSRFSGFFQGGRLGPPVKFPCPRRLLKISRGFPPPLQPPSALKMEIAWKGLLRMTHFMMHFPKDISRRLLIKILIKYLQAYSGINC